MVCISSCVVYVRPWAPSLALTLPELPMKPAVRGSFPPVEPNSLHEVPLFDRLTDLLEDTFIKPLKLKRQFCNKLLSPPSLGRGRAQPQCCQVEHEVSQCVSEQPVQRRVPH